MPESLSWRLEPAVEASIEEVEALPEVDSLGFERSFATCARACWRALEGVGDLAMGVLAPPGDFGVLDFLGDTCRTVVCRDAGRFGCLINVRQVREQYQTCYRWRTKIVTYSVFFFRLPKRDFILRRTICRR